MFEQFGIYKNENRIANTARIARMINANTARIASHNTSGHALARSSRYCELKKHNAARIARITLPGRSH